MLEPYELAPEPEAPDLPGTVLLRETEDELLDAVAADMLLQAYACVRQFGDFHVAISPRAAHERLYMRLMYDPGYRQLPWKRAHIWLVDDRRVPLDDERSGFRRVRELIAEHADIPTGQVHPIRATTGAAASEYEAEFREHLRWREPGHDRLDFVLLDVDRSGAIAGFHPGAPAAATFDRLVDDTGLEGEHDGVTMTFPMLNAARFLALFAPGDAGRRIVEAAGAAPGPDRPPALRLSPLAGTMRWYLDHEACGVGRGSTP